MEGEDCEGAGRLADLGNGEVIILVVVEEVKQAV